VCTINSTYTVTHSHIVNQDSSLNHECTQPVSLNSIWLLICNYVDTIQNYDQFYNLILFIHICEPRLKVLPTKILSL